MSDRPLVISAPEPRTLDLIFRPAQRRLLEQRYRIVEATAEEVRDLPDSTLGEVRHIIGQPPLDEAALAKMEQLRCIFKRRVEPVPQHAL